MYVRLEASLGDMSSSLKVLPDADRELLAKHVSKLQQIIRGGNQRQADSATGSGTPLSSEADDGTLFRSLLDVTGDGVAVVRNGVIVAANWVLADMFRHTVDALVGMDPMGLIAPGDRASVRKASLGKDGGAPSVVARGVRRDGSEFMIEIRRWDETGPTGHQGLIVVRDTSACHLGPSGARCHLEELAHAQRLSAIGEMASGLAHELNQPLAAIVNYTRGCIRRLQAGGCTSDHADIIDALEKVSLQGDRAGRILQRIRGFVRKREPRRTRVDLNEVASAAVGMTSAEAAEAAVSVTLDAHALPLPVEADQTQIEQVVLNLLRNSCDAMREDGCRPRRLTVRTRTNGESASVEVVDNGPGLTPEAEERVFEPFFTTRTEGMGLGLAISRSIADAHGGRLTARKAPGGGAAFRLTLPFDSGDEDHGK